MFVKLNGKENLLVFLINKQGFSVKTCFLEKIIGDKDIFRLSLLPSSLSGIISYKRTVIPVIDPSFFTENHVLSGGDNFLILKASNILFALQVDRIIAVTEERSVKFIKDNSKTSPTGRFIERRFLIKRFIFNLLELESLTKTLLSNIDSQIVR